MKRQTLFAVVRVGLILIALCGLAGAGQAANQTNNPTLNVDLGGGVTMELVLIKPGMFTMGDGLEARKVTITQPFYIGKYEVTQEQWERVMGSNPSNFKGAKNPVEQVSWEECQNFITKLKAKVPGQLFRLPTEAQWEYACRAGSAVDYCYGDGDDSLGEYAWYSNNSGSKTHPVGEKKPNAWGLYDMHGNVWEWCQDWYGNYSTNAETDPVGASSGSYRVLRGGSWHFYPTFLRSAYRRSYYPGYRSDNCGVRVVAAVGTPPISTPLAPEPPVPPPVPKTVVETDKTIDLGGGVTMELVLIRPGTFTMGSDKVKNEKPAHKVTITKPFYIGKYEVTQEQWEKVMGSNPSKFKGAKNPVETVNWEDCQNFITKLTEKVPGQEFRLPTEAQWEYACRAGSNGDYCYGDGDGSLVEYAWFDRNSGNKIHPVGEKKPNAWGLYDMHGNVWEWCQDWHGDYSTNDETDPVGLSFGQYRALRGNSLNNHASTLRSAFRYGNTPGDRNYAIGVRVVAAVGTP